MFDTNILLDVFQNRQPHYKMSAACVNQVLNQNVEGFIPAHALTTFYYVLRKYRGARIACEAVIWLLKNFTAATCDHSILEEATRSESNDFEDAVVATCAERSGCSFVLTRNPSDFAGFPVPTISPKELLQEVTKS
ncbi:MAG: PIN domain-containing protein [Candidatus Hydrogenedentota bacterium]